MNTPPDVNLLRRIKKYGLTMEQFKAIEKRSGGVFCHICGKPPKIGGRSLAIDHEHVTSFWKMPDEQKALYVRGLLCWACNTLLAKSRDNIETLKSAALYLQRYEENKKNSAKSSSSSVKNTKDRKPNT